MMFDFIRRLLQRVWDLIVGILGWRRPRPISPPDTCPISWQPSVLAPVFYGIRDYGPPTVVARRSRNTVGRRRPEGVDAGPPTRTRVFFPSLDGAVWDAPILEGCGRYPLIVLAHGNCAEPTGDHYTRWYQMPVHLARSGYVVVVPELINTAGGMGPWDNDAEGAAPQSQRFDESRVSSASRALTSAVGSTSKPPRPAPTPRIATTRSHERIPRGVVHDPGVEQHDGRTRALVDDEEATAGNLDVGRRHAFSFGVGRASGATSRPAAESAISRSSRRARVSGFFALTTQ